MSATADSRRDRREAILDAARALFAEVGYDRATVRRIAARAAVDPALVVHYFGSKERLFAEVVTLPVQPAAVLARALAAAPGSAGAALVRAYLAVWDPPGMRDRLVAMLRVAATEAAAAERLRRLLAEALEPVTSTLDLPDAPLRTALLASHLAGLAVGRYVLRLEPLASASADELARLAGPALDRYLGATNV